MNKAERLNQELIFLRDKASFQLGDLMSAFNISKRTALRDILALEDMGLPVYSEHGRLGGYRLIKQPFLTPIRFNLDELQAIFFAINAMESLVSNPFERSYGQIRKKMLDSLPHDQQVAVDKMARYIYFYATVPVQPVANLKLILQAILNNQVIRALDTQTTSTVVCLQIYELFYRNGIWFCNAQNLLTDQWGTYRCDYLTNVDLDSNFQAKYTLVELQNLKGQYESNYHDIFFRCQISTAGKEHFQRNHYPDMQLVNQDDQAYLVGKYNQAESDYLVQYLLSFGTNITVLSPRKLRQDYLRLIDEIHKRY